MEDKKYSKKELKQFTIYDIQDACVVLGTLISGVMINLEKYKEYAAEAKILLKNIEAEYIPAKEYDDINDKLLYRKKEILKLSADHQKSSFSYIDFRKILEKKGYLKSPLLEDVKVILNDMLDIRNWTFHNPQSMLVAAKEAAEKNIPKEFRGMVKIQPQLNPVIITKVEKYELIKLASLVMYSEKSISDFEKVLESMKNDYQEMYDYISGKQLVMGPFGFTSNVQYCERFITSSISDYQSDVAQISMAIQKSKYDGSEENYKKWVVRLEDIDENTSDKE